MDVKAIKGAVLKLPDGVKPTLRQILWMNGWKNKELAELMEVSTSCVSSWVCGVRHPSIEDAILISKTFGLTVEEINWWPERGKS